MGTELLVRRAQNGEKDAFLKLMKNNELAMYRAAKAILPTEEDVEDAVQETVCKAFAGLSGLRQPRYFKTWLTRILLNCCYDLLRQQRGELPLELFYDSAQSDGWSGGESDNSLDIQALLSALDPNDRLILTLYYLNDLSVKEVSRLLSLSESAVKKRLFRGRKRFQLLYENTQDGEE